MIDYGITEQVSYTEKGNTYCCVSVASAGLACDNREARSSLEMWPVVEIKKRGRQSVNS